MLAEKIISISSKSGTHSQVKIEGRACRFSGEMAFDTIGRGLGF
jgi:hypothetical protein